jgi:hypothetical protein
MTKERLEKERRKKAICKRVNEREYTWVRKRDTRRV